MKRRYILAVLVFLFASAQVRSEATPNTSPEQMQWSDSNWDTNWDSENENNDGWEAFEESSAPALPISGFLESTTSYRTKNNNVLAEKWVAQDFRGRIQTYYHANQYHISYKGEVYYDGIDHTWHAKNREAYLGFSPTHAIDVRAGRQPLTWGTGDLVFLNDFFPKDWVAFFSGYDQQYLKAPSDAIKISGYSDLFNIDVVWTPEFDPDNYITGEKLSFYSPLAQTIVAAPPKLSATQPGSSLSNGELAIRAYKNANGIEYAVYLYSGYFKTPEGFDTATQQLYFPELSSVGGSIRSDMLGGIGNAEYAYWHSKDSDSGNNAYAPPSQSRFLLGYEREIARNFTASFQYYWEYTHDYETVKSVQPVVSNRPRKVRQLLTSRFILNTQKSNLVYSAFVFYSPSDRDYYVIPNVMYRLGDYWQFNAGANLLGGQHPYTQFGQMETNSNAYLRAKYLF